MSFGPHCGPREVHGQIKYLLLILLNIIYWILSWILSGRYYVVTRNGHGHPSFRHAGGDSVKNKIWLYRPGFYVENTQVPGCLETVWICILPEEYNIIFRSFRNKSTAQLSGNFGLYIKTTGNHVKS